MSDFDLIAALEQRGAELRSIAGLFTTFRGDLIAGGFSTDAAEAIAIVYAETFITQGFEIADDEDDE